MPWLLKRHGSHVPNVDAAEEGKRAISVDFFFLHIIESNSKSGMKMSLFFFSFHVNGTVDIHSI